MTWIKLDDKTPRHPKIAGLSNLAFRWWINGLCYASEFLTDGLLPAAFWKTAPKSARAEITAAGLWVYKDPDFRIHDYLDHQQSREAVQSERRRNRDRRRTTGTLFGTTTGSTDEVPRPDTDTEVPTEKEPSATPHPVRELLTEHERCFVARYGQKPAKYSGKDAKHAKDLIASRGAEQAAALVRQAFASTDPFIANSGHSMGVIVSSSVQNRLIAEMSKRPVVKAAKPESLRIVDEMEAQRHAR